MLVLTRKQEQKICIGPHVTVTVLRVRGNSVKIGIEAPDGTRILRGELLQGRRKPSADGESSSRSARSAPACETAAPEAQPGSVSSDRRPSRPTKREAKSEHSCDGKESSGPPHAFPRRRARAQAPARPGAGSSLVACG
jgi:carbon storage regulator